MPYFDHNATTPLSARARDTWLRAVDEAWQNPSSPYRDAARVRVCLEEARNQLAELFGCAADRLVFNSGATEGANALFAHWASTLAPSQAVAINPTEHPCVLEAARRYFAPERLVQFEIDENGVVQMDRLEARLAAGSAPPPGEAQAGSTGATHADSTGSKRPGAIGAVSVMAANNETGVLQPWREIAALCRRHHVAYHCDASQWLGKLPAAGLGNVDWVTGTAHKFGGPKGTGFLKLSTQAGGFRAQAGGEQERGKRAGTEDYPSVAAMMTALIETETGRVLFETERLRWRDTFLASVVAALPGVHIVGIGAQRLWNTVSLILPHAENHRWVTKLDRRGFQVSTGSACAVGKEGPSHVLAAMGLAADEARRVIRVSSGWETTQEDWHGLATALAEVADELRRGADSVVTV